jgi:hypothetical protein
MQGLRIQCEGREAEGSNELLVLAGTGVFSESEGQD